MIEPVVSLTDRYELGPVIGRGGMAEVRAGRDTRLERPVAIKLLRSELAGQREVRARFEAEARLAARLSHPNVVAVFDSGEAQGVPFIVMERLPGETLHDRLAAGPLPGEEVADIAAQVLAALETAHRAGVLHRDIKPGNILAGTGGQWKIGDFGIAKALEADGGDGFADMTATGLLIGTPAYLAPERFFGAPATVASDLYSLAVVLYEATAGAKPFRTSRPEAWASLVAGTEAPPLSRMRPGIDPALEAVIVRAMDKDPARRYPSAAAMAAALIEGPRAEVPQTEAGPGASTRTVGAGPTRADWPPLQPTGGAAADQMTARMRPPAATDVLPLSERPDRRPGYGSGARPGPRPQRGGPGGLAGDVRVRLAVAGVIALAVIVGLVVALSGSHSGGSPSTPTPTTARGGNATAPAPGATTGPPATTVPGATPGTGAGSGPGGGAVPPALGRALHHLQQEVKR